MREEKFEEANKVKKKETIVKGTVFAPTKQHAQILNL